ncbi:winged helix-turn-helix transcriptional regulator [Patescibacteria group bacterium]|nr:winged helix-turn-helix transcriptional regulator [Patescibacteria group bacterium]
MIETPYTIFFRTLGNQTRLAIIYTLKSGEKNVTELTKVLKLKQTTISHNLRRLLRCQFIKIRQDGPFRYYSLNKETIEPILKLTDKHVNKYCKNLCKKK